MNQLRVLQINGRVDVLPGAKRGVSQWAAICKVDGVPAVLTGTLAAEEDLEQTIVDTVAMRFRVEENAVRDALARRR